MIIGEFTTINTTKRVAHAHGARRPLFLSHNQFGRPKRARSKLRPPPLTLEGFARKLTLISAEALHSQCRNTKGGFGEYTGSVCSLGWMIIKLLYFEQIIFGWPLETNVFLANFSAVWHR